VLPRCGRRRLRRLELLLALFWDLVITGSGTAKGRHDRAGLGKERLEMRERSEEMSSATSTLNI
jgi:hypothetical protein